MPTLPPASFPITSKIWLDGALVDWQKAAVHPLTHALHYGSAVFEGLRFYETDAGRPAIFRLKEHVARQFYSARAIGMRVPLTPKQLADAIVATVRANKIKAGYIRPLTFYGYGKMGLNPTGAPISTLVACWPWGSYLGGAPIRVQTSRFIRLHPQSVVADAKVAGHYVNSILASLEMQKAKMDEALFLDYRGHVAEGPGENLFFVKKKVIYTPALGSILAGITRDTVITLARDRGYKIVEGNYKLPAVYGADEAFFTGTAAEVQPIGQLDGRQIGAGKMGPVTAELRQLYLDVTHGRVPRYRRFLTLV